MMRFVQGGAVNVKCASFVDLKKDADIAHNENGP